MDFSRFLKMVDRKREDGRARSFMDLSWIWTVVFLLSVLLVYGQERQSNFMHLSRNFQAFSQVTYDELGYVWISDTNGLYKFDGHDFELTPYPSYVDREFSLKLPVLFQRDGKGRLWLASTMDDLFYIDSKGLGHPLENPFTDKVNLTAMDIRGNKVWLGAETGVLYCYDMAGGRFDHVRGIPPQEGGAFPSINDIAVGEEKVWAGLADGSIVYYDIVQDQWHGLEAPITDYGTDIIRLEIGTDGDLWIATELHGLLRYDIKKGTFQQFAAKNSLMGHEQFPMFISLYCDSNGAIWAGTDGNGLFRIDASREQVRNFKPDPLNKFAISNATITNIGEDAHENIWVVTKGGQIDVLPKTDTGISYYSGSKGSAPTRTLSVARTQDGSLWFGSDGNGLARVEQDGTRTEYSPDPGANVPFRGRYIQSLATDGKGNLWAGTYQNGLWRFPALDREPLEVEVKDGQGHKVMDVRTVFMDSKNRVWTATRSSLNLFDDQGKPIAVFDYGHAGLSGNIVDWIIEDLEGTIWIVQEPGKLYRLDETNGPGRARFEPFPFFGEGEDPEGQTVIAMDMDSQGTLYLLTRSRQLIKFDPKTGDFGPLAAIEGHTISSFLVDGEDHLWFGNPEGIHRYDPASGRLESFNPTSLFRDNFFFTKSVLKAPTGELFFGGGNGVVSFFPDQIQTRKSSAKLYISQIEVLNKPLGPLTSGQIDKRVELLEHLDLSSDQTSFSFQFGALDNVLSTNYHYAYRLKGFDADWIPARSNRIATYTNIPDGDYVFEVRAGSQKGVWDLPVRRMGVSIAPPWWSTIWAYIGYAMVVVALLYGFYKWLILRYRLQQESWKGKKEREMYDMKVDFFVKMSHEIQTPLTLIMAPIEDMLHKASAAGNHILVNRLHLIKNNANRLSRIASELTNLRDKEVNKLQVHATLNDFVSDVRTMTASFAEQAAFKNIEFKQNYPEDRPVFWYDRDKVEHVIYNLLSNAIKFTPSGGGIDVDLVHHGERGCVKLLVSDTGPGIPLDDQDKIFKLFYRSNLGRRSIDSSGIGLALAKELIELHHGEIHVESKEGKGTRFSIQLYTDPDLFTPEEKLLEPNGGGRTPSESRAKGPNGGGQASERDLGKRTVLVIEDHIEMQMFLKDGLSGDYNVQIASHGKEGVGMAKEFVPDLVVCDIMMPEMDGIEVCEKLKADKRTAAIPIILLTAMDAPETRLSGFESGAVAYVQKPFNFRELALSIQNMIAAKEETLKQLKQQLLIRPVAEDVLSKDEAFAKDLIAALSEHLEEPEFHLENLAGILNMSYSVIYRKCQEIMGKSLVDLQRTLKLKRAAQLIVERGYGVSEAAYIVGYKDSKYFSQCFKKAFGKSPSALKKEMQKKDSDLDLDIFGP
ncbi:ATP-binding protein [Flagellimonas oceanensis]|uniref:hybrid sensor histidine kinase/response regulator transcription factor n=1 Tax=Flagellimonas oceanensis TaxID=2499163 RepID=UPI003BAA145E